MLLLKLLQHIHLLLLITRRLPHLLLPLIIHHLLNHAPRLAIQIPQFAVLGLDLRDVDRRRRCNDMCPPLHLVYFVQVQFEDLGAGGRGRERPGGFVDVDFVGKVALGGCLVGKWERGEGVYGDDGVLAFDGQEEFLFLDVNVEVAALEVTGDFDGHVEVADCLGPFVR